MPRTPLSPVKPVARARPKRGPTASPISDKAHFARRKAALVTRLRRVEGQIRGVQAMVEREADCEAIARQLAAARAALDRAFYEMVACSIEQKVGQAMDSRSRAAFESLTRVLAKYG